MHLEHQVLYWFLVEYALQAWLLHKTLLVYFDSNYTDDMSLLWADQTERDRFKVVKPVI